MSRISALVGRLFGRVVRSRACTGSIGVLFQARVLEIFSYAYPVCIFMSYTNHMSYGKLNLILKKENET